jgi:hypothetical protein
MRVQFLILCSEAQIVVLAQPIESGGGIHLVTFLEPKRTKKKLGKNETFFPNFLTIFMDLIDNLFFLFGIK